MNNTLSVITIFPLSSLRYPLASKDRFSAF